MNRILFMPVVELEGGFALSAEMAIVEGEYWRRDPSGVIYKFYPDGPVDGESAAAQTRERLREYLEMLRAHARPSRKRRKR